MTEGRGQAAKPLQPSFAGAPNKGTALLLQFGRRHDDRASLPEVDLFLFGPIEQGASLYTLARKADFWRLLIFPHFLNVGLWQNTEP